MKHFVLLVVVRKMFACAYRSGHSLAFRWIPSEVKFEASADQAR